MLSSTRNFIVRLIGIGLVLLMFIVGILLLELENILKRKQNVAKDVSSVENQRNDSSLKTEVCHDLRTDMGSSVQEINSEPKCASFDDTEKSRQNADVQLRNGSNTISCRKSNISQDSQIPAANNKRETVCSIQDLLANTSVLSNLYNQVETTEPSQLELTFVISQESKELDVQSNHSINEVGLPIKEGSETSKNPPRPYNISETELVSNLNVIGNDKFVNANTATTSASTYEMPVDKLAQCTVSSNGDYENIYDSVHVEEKPEKKNSICRTLFLPKSLLLLQSIDESLATQSSGSHDYENIPSLNVYRANTGVRHWKTYLDIEDQVHDYSTFKDRSLIQDSTLASNIYGNNLMVSDVNENRPLSLAERANSRYSISLPDLTNIEPTACVEVQRVDDLNEEGKDKEAKVSTDKVVNSNEEQPSNYEAIWYEEDEDESDDQDHEFGGASQIFMGRNGDLKESMCNLYCSRLSDLSSKYFIHGMRRNSSLSSIIPGAVETQSVRNLMSSKPQFLFEVNDNEERALPCDKNTSLPNQMTTPIGKGKKIESKRTQKSPLMKLVSMSQNSLHEHTIKALQAGKRVFYRPRVHVITPKKGSTGIHRKISLKITTDDAPANYKIDPNILKKRSQLSPKDKLILSEASALIHKKGGTGVKVVASLSPTAASVSQPNLEQGKEDKCNVPTREEQQDGPQHSTPEGNRHLPQMSILSTISSVASPEESLKLEMESCFSKRSSSSSSSIVGEGATSLKRVSSGRLLQKRCSSKPLQEMSVIEEFETVPSQV